MTRRSAAAPVGIAIVVVALGAAPRVLLAAGLLPAPLAPFTWSDVLLIYLERLRGGALPYFDAFFEYPPLIGYASGALARMVPGAAAYVAAWAVVSAIAAGVVARVLARGSSRPLLWSLSPQLLLYGAMNFDVLAVAWLVGALALAGSGRPLASFAALGAGAVTKAFPALVAPVELLHLSDRRGPAWTWLGASVFAGVSILLALPSLIAPHPLTDSAIYVGSLTNFDSAWGLVLAAAGALGVPFSGEAVAIVSAVGMAVTYVWSAGASRGRDLATAAALALLAVLLWTRLYSPQYSLWVVPFFALGVLPGRAFALLCAADVIVFATVYPLTLVRWPAGDPVAALIFAVLAGGVVLRHAALIVAFVMAARARA